MPKSLEKARKRIAKKRNGNIVLHEFSRDTKKLHKAQVRDERLEKLAAARKKHDQPLSPPQPCPLPCPDPLLTIVPAQSTESLSFGTLLGRMRANPSIWRRSRTASISKCHASLYSFKHSLITM